MSSELKVGDVVTLKSGSPKMTVAHVQPGEPKRVRVAWFEGGAIHFEGDFPFETLEKEDRG